MVRSVHKTEAEPLLNWFLFCQTPTRNTFLYRAGFWGELADWDAGVTVVQKTHDSGADHVRSFSGGRSIFLNRNPYEAILSFHNFLYGGHVGHAPPANFRRSGKY